MKIVVIAPHPDDEVLGCGGTITRLSSEGHSVYVLIVTKGTEPMFPAEGTLQSRKDAIEAHNMLGVQETVFFDKFPAALLDTIPHSELNKAIRMEIERLTPDVLFVPFPGDIHIDHRIVFESSLVSCRPNGGFIPRIIFAYETLSETNWNAPFITPRFEPNTFIDIYKYLEIKVNAFLSYSSEVRLFPNERSVEAIRALAKHRGATVNYHAAEAFVMIRSVYPHDCKLFDV